MSGEARQLTHTPTPVTLSISSHSFDPLTDGYDRYAFRRWMDMTVMFFVATASKATRSSTTTATFSGATSAL